MIPDFLKHLPVYRGYPIPYFVPKDENGVHQLKYADAYKMDSCIKYHKCCICFRPLTQGEYFFISGPMGFKTQTDSHPPMHKQCAEYSLRVCPHLYFEKTHRTTNEAEARAEWQIREKPKEFYLVQTKKFEAIKPDGILVVKYSSVVTSNRFIYENGLLQKSPN